MDYTVKQIAEMEKVGNQTVHGWIKTGKLNAKGTGAKYLIPDESYQEFKAKVARGEIERRVKNG